jgi:6-phospho-3-hexuloisomerase
LSNEKIDEKEIAKGVKEEIRRIIKWMAEKEPELNDQQIIDVAKAILATQDENQKNIGTIFVFGLGRSGFVAKGFAMRLGHLGYDVRVLDEATVPPLKKEDLFIVVSGSGVSLKNQIETAIDIGAKIVIITSRPESVGARLADVKFIIPGREKEAEADLGYHERQMRGLPVFPLGTDFEIFAMVILDSIIAQLIMMKKKTEADLKKRHANLTER